MVHEWGGIPTTLTALCGAGAEGPSAANKFFATIQSRDMDRCSGVEFLQRHRQQDFMLSMHRGNRLNSVELVDAGEAVDSTERQQILRLATGG